mgnify:CR=1 FL=1
MSKKPIKKLADLAKEALDMSKEARMARAEKQGFDTATTYYHGTRGDISQFAKEAMGETTGAQSARKGFFFASEPETAAQYAEISSSRPALRGATGAEDKYYAEGTAALEFKRYMAEQDLKHLKDSNRHMEKYLAEMPKNRQYWLDSIEKAKGPPEIGVRSDGSTYEKYRTPEEAGLANLAKMEARAAEYKKALSKTGQKKLNAEIADQQAKLDEITNYIQDSQGGQNVVPVHLKLKNPLVHDFKGEHYREVSYNELMEKAKKDGHDGVIFKNTYDPGHKWGNPEDERPQDIVAVFKPEQIRSVNAAFDPKKKKSGNILAGGAVAALVAAGMSPEEAEAVIIKVNPNAKTVKTVEELLKVAQEQKLLHHATTKKAIESIAEIGLVPQRGKIVDEAYSETVEILKEYGDSGHNLPDDVSFLSETPAGYFSKWQIEAKGRSGKKAGIKEIQKDGGVGLFQRNEGIYRVDPDSPGGGEDAFVKSGVDPTKDASYPGEIPPWVERGDYFTPNVQMPDYIVTGKELKQYLQKADPHYDVYGAYENLPTVQERFKGATVPTKASKGKKIAGGAAAATLAASNDALAADLNSPVASGMGEVVSQAGHAMERFDAYTANPFRKFLNSALEGKGIIQSAREGVQAFGAEKPTTGEEVAKNFLSLSPNQNLGFPTADGGKDYPLAGPLGVAVDFAVDPTNIPMAKAVGPSMDAASSISRIIEQSLLKRGLVLP